MPRRKYVHIETWAIIDESTFDTWSKEFDMSEYTLLTPELKELSEKACRSIEELKKLNWR